MQDALSQLHDLHAPEPVSWWPPAPGWWLLPLLLLIPVLIFWLYRRRQRKSELRRNALGELAVIITEFHETNDGAALVRRLSILLRKVALHCPEAKDVAGLQGEAWLAWLDRQGNTDAFSNGPCRVLITAPYQSPEQISDALDGEALINNITTWIKRNT